ncbi:phage tail protein [Treponema sp. OMZ 792]|uniref:phage tail protein n=1 Tax=unclassified Treponema TaxID=2638727 RepID=UPI0020A441EE|nr:MULTISPECIES: phage tail protein [unclassified Treponema]UTC74151.1 phage tail protein [Treponema sp. OMZ 792]UTC80548.1 phage tail protein [Treponema sp. OMZ 798]
MNLQSNDKSHEALTVGSLKVLGNIDSGIINSIHTHLQSSDAAQSKIIADIEKLHENISADGVITANEKQILKKEVSIIETEYPIILQKAEKAKKSESEINAYKAAFKALRDYLFVELKIFDEMSEALEVDREAFNKKFADYYKSRAVLQVASDAENNLSFPPDTDLLGLINFDETPQALPTPDPSFTAWQSKIIEYDCTNRAEIKMTFEEAVNNVIILSGELKNDFTLQLFFNKQNGNGAKQYLIVYKLTGNFNVKIETEEADTNKISQNINAETFGLGCYAVVDFRGNVWAFEGNIKQSLIDEILQNTENTLNNTALQAITNFQNEVNSFFIAEKNKMLLFIQEKTNELENAHKDRLIKESGPIGEIRYFTGKKYTYGYLYANGYSFIPELYPEFYQFWLENFGNKNKKNYLGYDAFGYPKLPDLRGAALRAVDDGSGRGGASLALEYQGDAIRNIRGRVGVQGNDGYPNVTTGVFQTLDTGYIDSGTSQSSSYLRLLGFNASKVVPTAEDNRVKSYGVYPFIKVI